MFKLNSICQFLHYFTAASLIISNISFITVTSAAIDDHFEGCKPSYYSSSTTQNVGNGQIGLPENKITNRFDEIDGSPIQNAASENKPFKMTTTAESIVPEGQYENGQPTDETCQLPFEYPGRTCSANCAERSDCISVAGMFVPQYTRLNCFCHTNYTLTTASSEAYCLNNIWFSEIPECVPTEEFKLIEPIKPTDVEVSTKTPLKTSSIKSRPSTAVMCRFPTRVHGRTCSVSCPRQQSTVKCSSTPNSYIDQYAVLSCVCNDGYTLASGSSTAYCISGKWFMEEPYCSVVPPAYDYSNLTTGSTTEQTVLVTENDDKTALFQPVETTATSSVLVANETTHPVSNVTLSTQMCHIPDLSAGGAATCSVMCSEDSNNCTVGSSYVHQFTALFCSCNFGYTLATESVQVYCIEGRWLPNVPQCSRQLVN